MFLMNHLSISRTVKDVELAWADLGEVFKGHTPLPSFGQFSFFFRQFFVKFDQKRVT